MGPGTNAVSTIPSRQRFAWDARCPPWTDGRGNQERYKVAVEDWKEFNDALPDTSPNKIAAPLQGIVLKSQLYGQAADQCCEISKEQLRSADGVNLIVNAVYRRDFMSVISEAFDDFSTLLNTRRGQTESLKSFETRFSAAVSKFNSFSSTTKLPQCITALLLLNNAGIEHSQRVSALSAAAPNGASFTAQSTNDEFLSVVTYNQVSGIVKQCEKANRSPPDPLSASNGGGGRRQSGRNIQQRRNHGRKPAIGALKRMPCHSCGKFGHWKSSHKEDGTLPDSVKSFDSAEEFCASLGQSSSNRPEDDKKNGDNSKNTVSFNMARLSQNSVTLDDAVGPLVDDGAEYSALGIVELKLFEELYRDTNTEMDPIPASLEGVNHWQFGVGEHASESRRILGSVVLTAKSDSGRHVRIRHLVVEGSSQWVIGRNVTSKANLLHVGKNAIEISSYGENDYISMVVRDRLSFIPMSSFNLLNDEHVPVMSCLNGNTAANKQ